MLCLRRWDPKVVLRGDFFFCFCPLPSIRIMRVSLFLKLLPTWYLGTHAEKLPPLLQHGGFTHPRARNR